MSKVLYHNSNTRGTRNGARRQGNGEGGGRGNGEGRRRPCLLLPSFHSLFRTGAALAAPFLCFSNGGSECCPHVFSFHFERGQQALPPCLFFSFRTGAASAAPVSFLFVLNRRGGSVYPHAAPFLSLSNGGSVYRTRRPLFLSVSTGDSVKLTRRPRFVFFTPQ